MDLPMNAVELPLRLRILPGRRPLQAGLALGLALAVLCLGLRVAAPAAPWARPLVAHWAGALAGLAIAAGCAIRMFIQLPVIEVTELGIAIWLRDPLAGPFFIPWRRVRSVALTRVRRPGLGGGSVEALAIRIIEDAAFRFPALAPERATPVRGSEPSELAWPAGSLAGRLPSWVRMMQALRAAHDAQPAAARATA
jgi:hypothetical protein